MSTCKSNETTKSIRAHLLRRAVDLEGRSHRHQVGWAGTFKSAGYTFIHSHLSLHMSHLPNSSEHKPKQNQASDLHLQDKLGLRSARLKRSLASEGTGEK